jgi:hypothetical protein
MWRRGTLTLLVLAAVAAVALAVQAATLPSVCM